MESVVSSSLHAAGESEEAKTGSDPANSQQNNCDSNEKGRIKRLADAVKEKSKPLEHTGSLSVHRISLKDDKINVDGCRRFSFGKESSKRNRTVMVLGATGAGKSTLINGMMNYILGVKWEDSFRFKLVDEGRSNSQAHSQTSAVTVYKINHQDGFKIDHSLTIVDTPGFGRARGIKSDEEITEQLHEFLSAQHGLREIDAVCFVAQAALARLTPTHKSVFDSVLSIFGKDVAENIRVMVTFADGQRPPVLETFNASGVPCPKTEDGLPVHFKFNNSALFADNKSSAAGSMSEDDEDGGFDQMFWNMGTKSMKKFFDAFTEIKTKPMKMEVLKDIQQLESFVRAPFERGRFVETAELMKTCSKCLIRLKKKTLKADLLSASEYIDFLIEGERSEAKPGWKQRVTFLINMRGDEEKDEEDDDDDDGGDGDDDDDDDDDNKVVIMIRKLMTNKMKISPSFFSSLPHDDDEDEVEKTLVFFMTKMWMKMMMT